MKTFNVGDLVRRTEDKSIYRVIAKDECGFIFQPLGKGKNLYSEFQDGFTLVKHTTINLHPDPKPKFKVGDYVANPSVDKNEVWRIVWVYSTNHTHATLRRCSDGAYRSVVYMNGFIKTRKPPSQRTQLNKLIKKYEECGSFEQYYAKTMRRFAKEAHKILSN